MRVVRRAQSKALNILEKRRVGLAFFLVFFLLLSLITSPTALAADSTLSEVRSLLQDSYVEPVSSEVLNASTIEEILKKLGDPYTVHFSAKEYQDFLNSMDMTFTGIGIYIDIVPEGVLINSVIEGSPAAEVGLQKGDIILQANGQSLAGLPAETATRLLRGPEGSTVEITVKRGTSTFSLNVVRRAIEFPTVTGEVLDGHIGYVAVNSFGLTTPAVFETVVNNLKKQNVNSWIIDVRNNPGGYLSSALDLAGYFIGEQTALQTRDRTGQLLKYPGQKHSFIFNQPVIFLTNENSASASEILTAAVKDYHKAMIVGTRTYGKGSVQSMFPLSDGGVLKMTVAKFYSPLGKEINKVGINPDVRIPKADSQKAAELLLDRVGQNMENTSNSKEGLVQLFTNQKFFEVSLEKARKPEYWQAYGEILDSLASRYDLLKGSHTSWVSFTESEWAKRWPLYYPDYRELNELKDIPLDKKFIVHFSAPIDWKTVTAESVELVNAVTGERVPLKYEPLSEKDLRIIPQKKLEPGAIYWLMTHPLIKSVNGQSLQDGAVAVAKTLSDPNQS